MIIKSKKRFDKQFDKLQPKLKSKVKERIALFAVNPFNSLLNNHQLHGEMEGLRAFSVTGDIRIIFEECDGYTLVVFLDIGGHGNVYE